MLILVGNLLCFGKCMKVLVKLLVLKFKYLGMKLLILIDLMMMFNFWDFLWIEIVWLGLIE